MEFSAKAMVGKIIFCSAPAHRPAWEGTRTRAACRNSFLLLRKVQEKMASDVVACSVAVSGMLSYPDSNFMSILVRSDLYVG